MLIQNATVLTVTKGTFQGSVLIRDGKIAEVGEKIMAPAGATVIDATGQYRDARHHRLPLAHRGRQHQRRQRLGLLDGRTSKTCSIPDDIAIYRALAGGVTTANILHGSANSIGGKCTVLKMRWGKDAHDMIFEGAKPGIKFALGENPKRAGNPNGGASVSTPRAIPLPAWASRT